MQRVDGLGDEKLGGCLSQLVLWLADRGKGRRQHGGEFDVVITNDTHVTWHAYSTFGECPQYPESDLIVHADHRSRTVG